jgi:hypothetical protein
MSDGTSNVRNVRFDTNFTLSADSLIRSSTPTSVALGKQRRLYLGGQIRGGSDAAPIALEFRNSDTGDGVAKAIYVSQTMPDLRGTVKLNGTVHFAASNDIWGAPSTLVELSPTASAYVFKAGSGDVTTSNDILLYGGRPTFLRNDAAGTKWTFTGDITGGVVGAPLDLMAATDGQFVFSGADQTFFNWVRVRSGAHVVIAGADAGGVAWANSPKIWLKSYNQSTGTTALSLRGDYTLNQPILVPDVASTVDPVRIGQINDGATAFDAVFNGPVTVEEDDYEVLQLTADAGGSATFNGEINILGGVYGFDKVGAGTVSVNGRVSQASGNTSPIGPVDLKEGWLLINSPGGTDSFYTSAIHVAAGTTLGGSGSIVGDVVLGGSTAVLAPGTSAGTLTVDGDVDFTAGGVLEIELDGGSADRLDASGMLNLSGANDTLQIDILPGGAVTSYLIATYGTLAGTFENVLNLPTDYRLDYNYQGRNWIVLVAPEPGSVVLLLAGLVTILCWRQMAGRKVTHR